MSVSKESNGSYTVQCWYRDWTGVRKKKTKRGFRTKSEAVRWEREFALKESGSPEMMFSDFLKLYESDVKPHLKLNTWLTKEAIISKKILPAFGNKKLCEISATDVLAWQKELIEYANPKTGKGYAKTYLRTINGVLSSIFNHAVRYYSLPVNPIHKTGKIGSSNSGEMKFWTKEEYLQFSEKIMDKPLSFAIFELL